MVPALSLSCPLLMSLSSHDVCRSASPTAISGRLFSALHPSSGRHVAGLPSVPLLPCCPAALLPCCPGLYQPLCQAGYVPTYVPTALCTYLCTTPWYVPTYVPSSCYVPRSVPTRSYVPTLVPGRLCTNDCPELRLRARGRPGRLRCAWPPAGCARPARSVGPAGYAPGGPPSPGSPRP